MRAPVFAAMASTLAQAVLSAEYFEQAEPVWTGDAGMNANVAFEAEFLTGEKPMLRFTCAAIDILDGLAKAK